MHAAPPVAVRCTAGSAWRGLQAVLPALAAGVLLFWSLSTWAADSPAPLRLGLPLAAATAVGVLAWRGSSANSAWTLDWDGQRWALDGQPGELRLMIDLGPALLLRHAGKRWLTASRRDAGPAWHALRVAVHARSVAATGDDGGPHA